MNKEEIFNEISSCFKMSVDMNGMKKLEEYITNLQQQNQKYKEVIDKVKFAIKTNCIKNDKKYEEILCDGDYLLQILEDKEVE